MPEKTIPKKKKIYSFLQNMYKYGWDYRLSHLYFPFTFLASCFFLIDVWEPFFRSLFTHSTHLGQKFYANCKSKLWICRWIQINKRVLSSNSFPKFYKRSRWNGIYWGWKRSSFAISSRHLGYSGLKWESFFA